MGCLYAGCRETAHCGTVLSCGPATGQGSVALKEGDVIVTFTDGVSEAMNVEGDEFGEERLIAAVRPAPNVASAELITRITAAADSFAGSAPQHDDMTLVVVRCT